MKDDGYKKTGRFRFSRKQNHPSYEFGGTDDQKIHANITKSAKQGKTNNIPLSKNPSSNKPSTPAYMQRQVRIPPESFFSKKILNMQLSKEDEKTIKKELGAKVL